MNLNVSRLRGGLLLAVGFTLAATPAFASAISASGSRDAVFIAEIVLLLVVGRALGEGMQRLGQPPIVGQLIAGILLGPTVFGAVWPQAQAAIFPSSPEQKTMIDAVSQLGILMLLLLTGMSTDLKLVRKAGPTATLIAASGILVPFACGFALGQLLPATFLPAGSRLIPSLFLGTALSISSVKIVATIIREMNFLRRDIGQIIVAAAIIEDTAGWTILAVILGLATHRGFDLPSLAATVAGIAVFLGLSFTIGRRIVFTLIRWANDNFRSEFPVITMILVIMGVMAETTQLLGVHTVLGAFVAGILIGESPILTEHVEDELRGLITALFMPVFFGTAGLSADLTVLKDPQFALLAAGLVLIASLGKFTGAFIGGKAGGLSVRQSIAAGSAMNARGSTEVIVASLGLAIGALTQNLFTLIVTMAIITTVAMPPMLRRALAALPMGGDERKRVEREALDARGFVTNLERLLLAVDDSKSGKLAARIAGFVAGAQGMPITILHLDADGAIDEPSRQVKESAKRSQAAVRNDEAEPDPEKVHLTTRVAADGTAVANEARKGFDLMLVGLSETHDLEGAFSPIVARVVKDFDGPLAILATADGIALPTLTSRTRILVPVNGTPAARNAAEVAFAVARPTGARVTTLYVSSGRDSSRRRVTRDQEEAVLKDAAELGERYNVNLLTALQSRAAAEDAILGYANKGYGLIVMGVSRRPGEQLFFGNMASALLKGWKGSILFVAS